MCTCIHCIVSVCWGRVVAVVAFRERDVWGKMCGWGRGGLLVSQTSWGIPIPSLESRGKDLAYRIINSGRKGGNNIEIQIQMSFLSDWKRAGSMFMFWEEMGLFGIFTSSLVALIRLCVYCLGLMIICEVSFLYLRDHISQPLPGYQAFLATLPSSLLPLDEPHVVQICRQLRELLSVPGEDCVVPRHEPLGQQLLRLRP